MNDTKYQHYMTYLKGKIMQADVKTFRVLSYNFSRDNKNWYGENGEKILK